jgi:biopolymer transport protein ExbD
MGASIADTELDDDADFAETHEINVTPFIDVILVLLIIFMVAAPLSTVDLPIDLPSSTATPQKKPDKPVYVSIKPDLTLAIGEKPVRRAELVGALNAAADTNPERLVFVRADRGVAYGDLMDVLELLRQGNYRMKLVALEGAAEAATPAPSAARP